jgi:WD40 repeat protein
VLASGGANNLLKLWNPDDGALLHTLTGHGGPVLTAAFAPESMTLFSGGHFPDFSIRRWNAANGGELPSLTGHAFAVPQVVFTPDGQSLLSVGSYDQTRRRWDPVSGAVQGVDVFPNTSLLDVAVSPDGQLEALPADGNWSVVIRRTSDGAVQDLLGAPAPVVALEFSPDGTILAVGHDYFGGTVRLFHVPEFDFIRQMGEGEGPMDGLVFSPDGALLVTSNAGALEVFRVEDGAGVTTPHLRATNSAFSPDGALLAVNTPQVIILRVSDWSTVATLDTGAIDVEFSPDGRYLLTGEPARLRFWRVSDWSPQQSYDAETGYGTGTTGVQALAFSPDGCLFGYGRGDATVAMARNPFALAADLNSDLQVSLFDLATLVSNYGTQFGETFEDGDLDGDGDVDLADLTVLVAQFGRTCP